jgi:flagellar hook-length control protein FliK
LLPTAGGRSATEALREDCEKDSRREQLSSDPRELALGVAGHGTTRIIQDAERRMAPNSRSARRQVQADQQQQQRTFERSLADASARSNREVSGQSSKPAADAPKSQSTATPAKTDADKSSKAEPSDEKVQPGDKGDAAKAAPTPAKAVATAPTTAARPTPSVVATAAPAFVPATPSGQTTTAAAATSSVARVTAVRPATTGATRPTSTSSAPPATEQSRSAARRTEASAARPAKDPAPTTSKNDANTERILRVLRSQINENRAQATLRLDPPELGTIKLHMDLRQDVLALRVDTATSAAHRLLSEQVESLRQGLEAAGIQLERIDIRAPVTPGQSDTADNTPQPDTPEPGRDDSSGADTDSSAEQGMDSHHASAGQMPAREPPLEPATESLVNILA